MDSCGNGFFKFNFWITGCLAIGYPNDKLETVKVTSRRFVIQRLVEFSIEREGYIRATHIPRSDLASITGSVKLYRKLHPKEK